MTVLTANPHAVALMAALPANTPPRSRSGACILRSSGVARSIDP